MPNSSGWHRAVDDDIPSGWYGLCGSEQVPEFGSFECDRFGQRLSVEWRGASASRLPIVQSVGRTDSRCEICDRHPAIHSLGPFEARHDSGVVLVWYDALGRPPQWEPRELALLEEALSDTVTFRERVNATTEPILLNYVDVAHFPHVHGNVSFPGVSVQHGPTQVEINTQLGADDPNSIMTSVIEGPGRVIQYWKSFVTQVLPGPLCPHAIELLVRMSPAAPLSNADARREFEAYAARAVDGLQQDCKIWQHQRLPERAVLHDEPEIARLRSWYRTFSPRQIAATN